MGSFLSFRWMRRAVAVLGMVLGLGLVAAPTASATTQVFNFSYSNSTVSFTALIATVLDPSGYWIPTSIISGNRNGVDVAGLTPCEGCILPGNSGYPSDDYITYPQTGGAGEYTQLQYLLTDASIFTFNFVTDYGGHGAVEWAGLFGPQTNIPPGGNIGFPYTADCAPNGTTCLQMTSFSVVAVPEISLSAGLSALAALFGLLLLAREWFLRPRGSSLAA